MSSTTSHRRFADCAIGIVGDAGTVSAETFGAATGMTAGHAAAWLKRRAEAGYLYRDEAGAYRTSCPWPRTR